MSSRHPFPNNKRAHDDDTSGRTADKESPLPAPDNLPNEADRAEMRDNGRASEAAMWDAVVALGPALPESRPLDPELARIVGGDLADAREKLIDDMKMLDGNREQAGAAEAHIYAGLAVNAIDDAAEVLRREIGS